MSSITDIKRRIIELGPAEFQEFCDTFLSKRVWKCAWIWDESWNRKNYQR